MLPGAVLALKDIIIVLPVVLNPMTAYLAPPLIGWSVVDRYKCIHVSLFKTIQHLVDVCRYD